MTPGGDVRPARLRAAWVAVAAAAVAVATLVGLARGPVSMPVGRVFLVVLDHVPGVHVHTGLSVTEEAIVWQLRLPRVVLGLLVGAMLAMAGSAYQGVFRNPLADPYLLGAAQGAGLGATLAIVGHLTHGLGPFHPVPLAAFAGSVGAVLLAYALASIGPGERSPAALLLAGIAVAAFFAAAQSYVQQRHADTVREVYSWLLGRLATAGWDDVRIVLPYAIATTVALVAARRSLDVLSVGDEEAAALGLHVRRTRVLVVLAASLATAAAVSVSGLIGFVGIVVPHTVRLLAGSSYRVIVPLSVLFGGAFLTLADLVARTIAAPAEIPIGVVTAVIGAPFFALVLRSGRRLTL